MEPNKECALFIEKISRQEFKDITIGNSFEYLDSRKLAKYFKIIKNEDEQLERRDYYLAARELYTKILSDFHMHYPDEKNNFGNYNHPKCQEDENFNIIITNSVTQLTKDKLPNYVLKECIIEKKEIVIQEQPKEILEINIDQETLIKELKLEKTKTKNLLNIIEKEAPSVFSKFIEQNSKREEHHTVWAKNKIFQYTLDGKFIKELSSVSETAKINKCSPKLIRNHTKNK